jgi:hypothetical protein
VVRLLLVGLVTLLVGGAIVGFVLFRQATPDGLPTAAGSRALADYLAREHLAAAQQGGAQQFTVQTHESFKEQTGVWLGRQMEYEETLFAPDSGVRFIGASESQVPGPGRSVHMLFATADGAWASVFLQQYRATPTLDRGVGYTLPAPALGKGAPPIMVYLPGGQTHYLVSQKPEGVAALRRALELPEPSKKY